VELLLFADQTLERPGMYFFISWAMGMWISVWRNEKYMEVGWYFFLAAIVLILVINFSTGVPYACAFPFAALMMVYLQTIFLVIGLTGLQVI
jgi:hypothetical protein